MLYEDPSSVYADEQQWDFSAVLSCDLRCCRKAHHCFTLTKQASKQEWSASALRYEAEAYHQMQGKALHTLLVRRAMNRPALII